MKFRYLREVSSLWAERKWSPEDKLTVLAAVEYLIGLKDEDYAKQYVEHMASLMESMERGEGKMYKSVFERVYTAQGRAEGRAEGRTEGRTEVALSMLADGLPPETVRKYTGFTESEIAGLKMANA
jgi:predicted transposase YdaD